MWITIKWGEDKHQIINDNSISYIRRFDTIVSTERDEDNHQTKSWRNKNVSGSIDTFDIVDNIKMKYRYTIGMNDGTAFTNCRIVRYDDESFKDYIKNDKTIRKVIKSVSSND